MFSTLFLIFFLARDAVDDPVNVQVRNISREVVGAIALWRASLEAPRDERSPLALED